MNYSPRRFAEWGFLFFCIFYIDTLTHGEQMFFKRNRFAKTDTDKLNFISSYFHGNIRARLGRIITAIDVERKRKEVTSYVF
jgi:hypothetical protein